MNEKISKILYQNINEFVSGQEIADTLGVSRVAISNSIKELKNKGLDIISISKKGHKLIKLDDILDNDVIAAITGKKTYFLETCESTNIEARKLIENQDFELVVADSQKLGRGRRGRAFVSDTGGVYMSYIIKPDMPPRYSMLINLAAGLAVFDTLKEYGFEPFLKYPNDIYINGKKVCGILTETLADVDTLMWAIVGIGVNVNNLIDRNLKEIAVSLYDILGKKLVRAEIIKEIIKNFDYYLTQDIVMQYKQKCAMIGTDIIIINDDNTKSNVIAEDIREDGLLIVSRDGQKQLAIGGEVSVRPNN